jgi:hypothetical protein
MVREVWFKVIVAMGFITVLPGAHAIENPMKPGSWESRVELTVDGKSQTPKTKTGCVDQAWIDEQKIFEATQKLPIAEAISCKIEGFQLEGNKASWRAECILKGDGHATIVFENEAKADALSTFSKLDAFMGTNKRSMSFKTTMKRLGACGKDEAMLTGRPAR